MVIHVQVTFRLEHCNALYMGLPLKTAGKLLLIQNVMAWLLLELDTDIYIVCPSVSACWFLSLGPLNGLELGYLKDHLLPYCLAHHAVCVLVHRSEVGN